MNANQFKDEGVNQKVLEWQKTKDDMLASEIYEIYARYFQYLVKTRPKVEDLSSAINETFTKCLLSFNPKKQDKSTNFTAYLLTYVRYSLLNQSAYSRRMHHGVPLEITGEKTPTGRIKRKVDTNHGNSWIDVNNPAIGHELSEGNDSIKDHEFNIMLREALSKVTDERHKKIVLLTLAGYGQKEIGDMLGLNQSRIYKILKQQMPRWYPEFVKIIKDYCNNNVE